MIEITEKRMKLYFSILSENGNFNIEKYKEVPVVIFMVIIHNGERNIQRILDEYLKFPKLYDVFSDEQLEDLISSKFREYYLTKYQTDIDIQKREREIDKLL